MLNHNERMIAIMLMILNLGFSETSVSEGILGNLEKVLHDFQCQVCLFIRCAILLCSICASFAVMLCSLPYCLCLSSFVGNTFKIMP